jgi:DNA-directed RNA polymerase subunit RPC12/RpoP
MAEKVVRCPYCVLGDHFRPMLSRSQGWFICLKCGHTTNLEKPELKCFCQRCGALKRAA